MVFEAITPLAYITIAIGIIMGLALYFARKSKQRRLIYAILIPLIFLILFYIVFGLLLGP